MAIMLPPTLQTVSDLSGVWFPNVNEDIIHAHGDVARVANAGSERGAGGADTAVRSTSDSYKGEGATQLQSYWQTTGNETGHMAQISAAAKVAPVALDGIGGVASGTKVAIATVLSAATVRLAYTSLLGPAAGPATIQTLLATRNAGMRIVREVAEGIEKRLGPGMIDRLKGPVDRAAEKLRLPGGPGSPAFAGAGHARIPPSRAGNAFDKNPGILQRGGGRGGGRGRTEANQQLSKKEQEALEAKAAGKPYDRAAANSAEQKRKKEEKFQGDRNAQKRGREPSKEVPKKETRREKRAREQREREELEAQQDGSNAADNGYNTEPFGPDGKRRTW
ncbi:MULTISPECIES: hypothetical protein [unclassified Streptosporangium]|uniref:hypothetical protein n=1 Tax=unclassified Streptosporangium TaxID=2632669 RepID=UPI002E2CF29E|nr:MULTISPECIES: hypothetical protein [unclassified Streptosporangium]